MTISRSGHPPSRVIFLAALGLTLLSGCTRSSAEPDGLPGEVEPAARYNAGRGVQLTAFAREFVGLATADFSGRVPPEAILHTVQGTFVYVENGGWFLRTPVKVGAHDGPAASSLVVSDGLYEGDRIVTRGAKSLWLAELHFLRAGQACAHKG